MENGDSKREIDKKKEKKEKISLDFLMLDIHLISENEVVAVFQHVFG